MSMLEIQRTTLNDFGNSQPAFKPFGQLTGNTKDDIKLGNLIAGDGLIDGIKNKYISHMFKLPAPAVGLYYQHMPIFKVPCNGFITKGDLYCYDSLVVGGSFTSATTASKDYGLTAFTYYNNFSNYVNSGIHLLTGMENNTYVDIPLSVNVGLLQNGGQYAMTVSGKDIVFTATTVFRNTPSVGDFLDFNINGTPFLGPNCENVGLYKVTEVNGLVIKATKINRTNPVAIAPVVVVLPGDVDSISIYSPAGYPVSKGDMFGLWMSVPVSGGSAVDVSGVSFCANFTFQPTLTFT